MSKGRIEEAETVLCRLAAENGVEVSEKSISIIRNSGKNLQDKVRIIIVIESQSQIKCQSSK